uniref:Uncharacterized protein n=1 Tax=Leersia perrieri TaxID=77586 RepID=A0A0D9WXB9_9ORYZ
MSTIVVSKSPSVVVRPSETVTTAGKKGILSPADKALITLPSTVLYAFEQPIHEPVESIRRGLSQALVHYYPMAGRLAGGDEDLHIDCNGEGVAFTGASANCTIKELMSAVDESQQKSMMPLLEKLVYSMERFTRADPFVLMQVTTFRCGGSIVGVTWDHGVADGFGIARFMQAVGELARGSPTPSVVPVWCKCNDDQHHQQKSVSVPVLPPYTVAALQVVSEMLPPASGLGITNITIPASLINRIRRGGCSHFEAVAAVLWRCRTRIVMSDPETPALLMFTANARKYMGLDESYYGNCVALPIAVEKCGVVAHGGDIMDVVAIIRRAKEQVPEHFKENGDVVAGMLQAIGDLRGQVGYHNAFGITSWRNIGFEDVDFGCGTPSWVLPYVHNLSSPICVVCPQTRGDQQGACRVISYCVAPQHADAFHQEIATL